MTVYNLISFIMCVVTVLLVVDAVRYTDRAMKASRLDVGIGYFGLFMLSIIGAITTGLMTYVAGFVL